MAYKAFVSSTFEDLKKHRKQVISSLRKAGIFVDPMEDWTASSDAPKKFSQERLQDCDLCILLVGFRRGHIPEGENLSITQLEFQAAVQLGLDVLVFMLAPGARWPEKFNDLKKDPEIIAWRAELQENWGVGFFGPDPKSIEIAPALTRWVAAKQQAVFAGAIPRPPSSPWSAKTVRLGIKCGLLQPTRGGVEFTDQVADSLWKNGRDWILGRPFGSSKRVLSDWMEYSTMSLVVATKPETVLAEELQEQLYIECQNQLTDFLLELALSADVMLEADGNLRVADDLSEEMMETFDHLDSLDYLDDANAEPKTAAVLAFIDMVRARLLLKIPDKSAYAEALGTLILSGFNFWTGPGDYLAVLNPAPEKKSKRPQKTKNKTKAAGTKNSRRSARTK